MRFDLLRVMKLTIERVYIKAIKRLATLGGVY